MFYFLTISSVFSTMHCTSLLVVIEHLLLELLQAFLLMRMASLELVLWWGVTSDVVFLNTITIVLFFVAIDINIFLFFQVVKVEIVRFSDVLLWRTFRWCGCSCDIMNAHWCLCFHLRQVSLTDNSLCEGFLTSALVDVPLNGAETFLYLKNQYYSFHFYPFNGKFKLSNRTLFWGGQV